MIPALTRPARLAAPASNSHLMKAAAVRDTGGESLDALDLIVAIDGPPIDRDAGQIAARGNPLFQVVLRTEARDLPGMRIDLVGEEPRFLAIRQEDERYAELLGVVVALVLCFNRVDAGADGTCEIPRSRFVLYSLPQDQPRFLFHRTALTGRVRAKTGLHIIVEIADRNALDGHGLQVSAEISLHGDCDAIKIQAARRCRSWFPAQATIAVARHGPHHECRRCRQDCRAPHRAARSLLPATAWHRRQHRPSPSCGNTCKDPRRFAIIMCPASGARQ